MAVLEAENLKASLSDSSFVEITTGFEEGIYSLTQIPVLLTVEESCVFYNKDWPQEDELEALNQRYWNKVPAPKFRAHTYRDSWLYIGIISTKYFDSREKFDAVYSREWKMFDPDYSKAVERFEKITFQDALKDHLSVKIWCNLDYYLSNKTEMEKDLGYNLEIVNPIDNHTKLHLKKKLFFKSCIDIFGDINDEEEKAESEIFLRDFHVLYKRYDYIYATARRGQYYLIFFYEFI